MQSTTCFIDGKECRLDFDRTSITSGTLYHGTVFERHVFDFFFVVFDNGSPMLFSPLDTTEPRKIAIVTAVKNAEEHHTRPDNPLSNLIF